MSSSTTNIFQSPSNSGTKKKKKKKKSTGGAPPSMPNQAPQQQPPRAVTQGGSLQQQPPRAVTQGGSLQQQPPCQVQQQPQPPIEVLPHRFGAIVSENGAIPLRDAAARRDTGRSLSPIPPTLPPAQATVSTVGRSTSPVPPSQGTTAMVATSSLADEALLIQDISSAERTPAAVEALRSFSRTSSTNDLRSSSRFNLLYDNEMQQSLSRSSSHNNLHVMHDEDDIPLDSLLGDDVEEEPLETEVDNQSPGTGSANNGPPDWNTISPNHVMARLKLLKVEVLQDHDLRPFYKSYSNWEKMTREQQNKAVAWYRKLPENLKCKYFYVVFNYFYLGISFVSSGSHNSITFISLRCDFADCQSRGGKGK